jgi:hypothetical protein
MTELVEALSLSSLVGGTLEYAILIRHRRERRADARLLAEMQSAGREALLRARLLDRGRPARRWNTAATRFR